MLCLEHSVTVCDDVFYWFYKF